MLRPRKIASHWVLSPQGLLKNAIVSVDEYGIIEQISTSDRIDVMHGVEFYSGLLMPSMVNAHSHIELSCMVGAIMPGGGFANFASSMGAHRGGFTEIERQRAISYNDAKMWSDGVGAVADICNSSISFNTKSESKIFYRSFAELFGLWTTSVDGLRPLIEMAHQQGIACCVTPHSAYSLNIAPFEEAIQSTPTEPLSIHFMESVAERALYAHRGELWDWYQERGFKFDFQRYASPTRRIIECVSPDRDILLVHNTFVERAEVEALQMHFGEHLTWVLCPRSNQYITGSLPPVQMLRDCGARIAVGTDSLASNRSLSMIDELKLFKNVPLEEILGWATVGGARALGMECDYSTIEVGRKASLVLLTGVDWQTMSLTESATTRRII